jgi:hypothetical protein
VVRSVGVGLDPAVVAQVRGAGLQVVGRVSNWDGVTPESISWTLGQLRGQGVGTVIFSGDEVLGYKGYVADDPEKPGRDSTESALRRLGLFYGTVEFVKQKGDPLLTRAAVDPGRPRAHDFRRRDGDGQHLRERPALSARGARAQHPPAVRAPVSPGAGRPERERRVREKIARGLEPGRLEPGPAHGYAPLRTPLALRLLMTVGIAAAWCLLVDVVAGFLGGARRGRGRLRSPAGQS